MDAKFANLLEFLLQVSEGWWRVVAETTMRQWMQSMRSSLHPFLHELAKLSFLRYLRLRTELFVFSMKAYDFGALLLQNGEHYRILEGYRDP
jgi:hypothetical protein